jgi:hypothetical protein
MLTDALDAFVERLKHVPGIVAIVVGGSQARGTADPSVQWIASEKRGESVLPVSFWHFSIAASMILGAYFIFRRDPVGIVSSLPNSVIYLRNLHLIRRKARLANELESAEVCRRSTRVPNRKDTEK